MKFMFTLFCIVPMLIAGGKRSCCGPTAPEEFAAFGKEMAFVALHEAPVPFEFAPSRGTTTSLKVKDGSDAKVFEVPAVSPTANYLFVFHEWWGLNDYIRQEAERLQREVGNVNVIAIDLYDGKVAATPDSARSYMGQVSEERARAIIAAAIEHAGKKARIATIGWCFGGGWSMQASLMLGKQAAGCVIYYGMPEKDAQKLNGLACDVLGIFALKDGFITPQVVSEFEKNMASAKKKLTVMNFDAVHAFANPSNPSHDKEKTAQANVASIAFLRTALKVQ